MNVDKIKVKVWLKGRVHHRQGNLLAEPYVIDRQSWNSKDANALVVYDRNRNTLGFVEKDIAAILGPLIRAGYFADLEIHPENSLEKMENVSQLSQVPCVLTLKIEPAKVQEFHSLGKKDANPSNVRIAPMFQPKKAFSSSTSIGSSSGFVKASQMKVARDDSEVIQAKINLDQAINRENTPSQQQVRHVQKAPKNPQRSATIAAFFDKKKSTGLVNENKRSATTIIDEKAAEEEEVQLVQLNDVANSTGNEITKASPTTRFSGFPKQFKVDKWLTLYDLLCGLRVTSKGMKLLVDQVMPSSSFKQRRFYSLVSRSGVDSINDCSTSSTIRSEYASLLLPMTFDERQEAVVRVLAASSSSSNQNEQFASLLRHLLEVEANSQRNPSLAIYAKSLQDELRICQLLNSGKSGAATGGLTQEQCAVLQARCVPGATIRISAYAGSGKTTTLFELAKTMPDKKLLYLCFNKSVQVAAELKFPSNVRCRTIHSLAFEITGYKPYACDQMEDLDAIGAWVSRTYPDLVNWEDSESSHGVIHELVTKLKHFLNGKPPVSEQNEDHQSFIVKAMWEAMVSGALPLTYSGVLKACVLKQPRLDFDVILLDEAQDCNPCALDLVMSQKHCARILVGDPHQAIYGFTDAKNALHALNNEPQLQDYALTKSFRFGYELAGMVSRFLHACNRKALDGSRIQLTGRGHDPSEVWISSDSSPTSCALVQFCRRVQKHVRRYKPSVCFVSRTNAACLEAISECLQTDPQLTLSVIGGLKAARMDDLIAIVSLLERDANGKEGTEREHQPPMKRIKTARSSNAFPDRFDSVNMFIRACRARGFQEWMTVLNMVRRWGVERAVGMIGLINSRSSRFVNDTTKADVIFSTVHRVKGLEFDGIFIADDFEIGEQINESQARFERLDEETVNLLYVAFTRAKRFLQMSRSFMRSPRAVLLLQGAIVRPCSSSKSVPMGNNSRKCVLCELGVSQTSAAAESSYYVCPVFKNDPIGNGVICQACQSQLMQTKLL